MSRWQGTYCTANVIYLLSIVWCLNWDFCLIWSLHLEYQNSVSGPTRKEWYVIVHVMMAQNLQTALKFLSAAFQPKIVNVISRNLFLSVSNMVLYCKSTYFPNYAFINFWNSKFTMVLVLEADTTKCPRTTPRSATKSVDDPSFCLVGLSVCSQAKYVWYWLIIRDHLRNGPFHSDLFILLKQHPCDAFLWNIHK